MKLARLAGTGAVLVLALSAVVAFPVKTDAQVANSRKALTQTIHELNVDGRSLEKTIDFLRNVSGANIVVNWKVLESVNVMKETPISLNVRELTLHKMLQLVLDQASPNTPLIYQIDSNVIQVTTQDDADKQMITKVYIVDDLIMAPANKQAPQLNLNQQNNSVTTGTGSNSGGFGGSSGGMGSGGSGYGNSGSGSQGGIFGQQTNTTNQQTQKTAQQRGDDLAELIRQVIRPNIWRENNGPATIKFFNGKLLVTAPLSVHEAIGGPIDSGGGLRFGN